MNDWHADVSVGDGRRRRSRERSEKEFLNLWRWIAIGTNTFLIAFTAMADTLGRLLVNPDFHVSEVLFGGLIAAWLVLLGFEGGQVISRLRGKE